MDKNVCALVGLQRITHRMRYELVLYWLDYFVIWVGGGEGSLTAEGYFFSQQEIKV